MQQTEMYKLNLIERSDPFSPDGLNANTQKIEDVLSENLAGMRAEIAGISKQVGTHGRTCRVVYGSYTGDGRYGKNAPCSLSFGLIPLAVRIDTLLVYQDQIQAKTGTIITNTGDITLFGYFTWQGDSLSWYSTYNAQGQFNETGKIYPYFAIGYDPAE